MTSGGADSEHPEREGTVLVSGCPFAGSAATERRRFHLSEGARRAPRCRGILRAGHVASSAMMENRIGHLWTMRDGRAIRLEAFRKREDALEAAESLG